MSAAGSVSRLLLIALKVSYVVSLCVEPSVHTSKGTINGTVLRTRNGRRFSAFLGVPYAEPPIGNLRFRSPVPKSSWKGTLLAKNDKPECPQLRANGNQAGEEDCLYLNVYTPQLCVGHEKSLAVMFFIYGGSFTSGSGRSDKWGPEYILDRDVILVMANYRIGALGFLSTGDEHALGNFGLKDQQLALKWVQQNIRAFGGDPNRVTLFGHSAGGMSARYQAMSPKSAGLFQRYIIMSGAFPLIQRALSITQYSLYGKIFAESLGCPTNTSNVMVSCLRGISVARILKAKIQRPGDKSQLDIYGDWSITIEPESKDAFLTANPDRLKAIDQMADLPFMIGSVQDEGLVATLDMYTDDSISSNLMRNVTDTITKILEIYRLLPMTDDKRSQLVKDIKHYYFGANVPSDNRQFIRQLTNLFTDVLSTHPILQILERKSERSRNPIYAYRFEYRGSLSRTLEWLPDNENVGVTHADELTYFFPIALKQFGASNSSLSEDDRSLIDTMVDLWTSFAINGTPTTRTLTREWTPYSQNWGYLRVTNDANGAPVLTPSTNYPELLPNLWNANVPV